MIKKIQKLASFLIGTSAMLTLPVVALADRQECCPSLEVILTGGWFAADGADTAYAIDRSDVSSTGILGPNVMPSGDLESIDPKYKFGGGIALAYQSDCCYNFGASYLWYYHSKQDSVRAGNTVTAGSTISPPGPGIGPILIPPFVVDDFLFSQNVVKASSDFKFRYNFANVELGSWICVISDCLKVNPKLGLSYAQIRDHQLTTYTGLIVNGAITGDLVLPVAEPNGFDEVEVFSRYRGFGPSIGADVVYLFCEEFQLFGNLRYSALVGSLHGTYINTLNGTGTAVVATDTGTIHFHTERHMVKLFQSELGLGLNFEWCGYCGNIKAGYQLTQALDSVNRIGFVDASAGFVGQQAPGPTDPSSTASSTLTNNIINASFHGPFVRVSAKFGI